MHYNLRPVLMPQIEFIIPDLSWHLYAFLHGWWNPHPEVQKKINSAVGCHSHQFFHDIHSINACFPIWQNTKSNSIHSLKKANLVVFCLFLSGILNHQFLFQFIDWRVDHIPYFYNSFCSFTILTLMCSYVIWCVYA